MANAAYRLLREICLTDLPVAPLDISEDSELPLALRAHEHEKEWLRTNYPFLTCETVLTGEINSNDVIAALRLTDGNLVAAASILGLTRFRLRNFIDKTPAVSQFLFELKESILDVVENNLYRQALNGDAGQIRFILQTIGKDRGYTTKNESNVNAKIDTGLEGLLDRIATAGKPLVSGVEYTEITEETDHGLQETPEIIETEAEISDDSAEPGPVSGSSLEDRESLPDN